MVSYCQEDFLPPRPILSCRLASLLLQAPCRIRGTYRRPLLGTSSGLPGGRLGMCPENMIKCTRASLCPGAKTLSLCIDRQHMYETVSLENKMGIYPMAPLARFVVSRKTYWPQAFSS